MDYFLSNIPAINYWTRKRPAHVTAENDGYFLSHNLQCKSWQNTILPD